MKKSLFTLCLTLGVALVAQAGPRKLYLPTPSKSPSEAQQKQIERRYGMFIHFGINTFHDQEWTDGSKPASSYAPTQIDAEQWIRTARDAGMKLKPLTVAAAQSWVKAVSPKKFRRPSRRR